MYGLELTVAPTHEADVINRLALRRTTPIEDALLFVGAFEMTF